MNFNYLVISTSIIFSLFLSVNDANANSKINASETKQSEEILTRDMGSTASVPQSVIAVVIKDIIARSSHDPIEPEEIKVLSATRKIWTDGCLGLPGKSYCTKALVPGWRVTVAVGRRSPWIYRTDDFGYTVRLESY